jgi:Tol biopolymer transport system component
LKIPWPFAVAALVPLLFACSVSDDLPTQTEVPSLPPPPSSTPLPAMTATVAATILPQPTEPVLLPTQTVASSILIPEADSSVFAYAGPGSIELASSDGEASILIALRTQSYASYSSSPFIHALAPSDGSFAYVTPSGEESSSMLWIYQPNSVPQALLEVESPPHIESVAISQDGSQIAYSLLIWGGDDPQEWYEQLWVVGSDGSDNRLVADRTGDSIIDRGPFRLGPVAWSEDLSKVYMVTNTDSEATPTGLYVADLETGEILKANTPQETLWRAMFNTDRSEVVYTSFVWVDVPNSMPDAGPPYSIKITELATGDTAIVWESAAEFVSNAVWSPNESALAFSKNRNALVIVDIKTGALEVVLSGESRVRPLAWLSDGTIVYSEGDSGVTQLMTVHTDGSEPTFIANVSRVHVLGELPHSPSTP